MDDRQSMARLLGGFAQTELGFDRPQVGDDVLDVLVERYAQVVGSPFQRIAVDRLAERLVLQLLLDRLQLQILERAAGPHESAGEEESGQLVDRVQRLLHPGFPGHARIIGVAEDRATHLAGPALLVQDLDAHERVSVLALVLLVIEVVEEPDDAPHLHVFTELLRIAPHGRLYGHHVSAQAFAIRVLRHQAPRVVAALSVDGHRVLFSRRYVDVELGILIGLSKYNRQAAMLPTGVPCRLPRSEASPYLAERESRSPGGAHDSGAGSPRPPRDVPPHLRSATDRRQGDPAQAAEPALLSDLWRRPRGRPGRGGVPAEARRGLVVPLLPRPGALPGSRNELRRHAAPGRRRGG